MENNSNINNFYVYFNFIKAFNPLKLELDYKRTGSFNIKFLNKVKVNNNVTDMLCENHYDVNSNLYSVTLSINNETVYKKCYNFFDKKIFNELSLFLNNKGILPVNTDSNKIYFLDNLSNLLKYYLKLKNKNGFILLNNESKVKISEKNNGSYFIFTLNDSNDLFDNLLVETKEGNKINIKDSVELKNLLISYEVNSDLRSNSSNNSFDKSFNDSKYKNDNRWLDLKKGTYIKGKLTLKVLNNRHFVITKESDKLIENVYRINKDFAISLVNNSRVVYLEVYEINLLDTGLDGFSNIYDWGYKHSDLDNFKYLKHFDIFSNVLNSECLSCYLDYPLNNNIDNIFDNEFIDNEFENEFEILFSIVNKLDKNDKNYFIKLLKEHNINTSSIIK